MRLRDKHEARLTGPLSNCLMKEVERRKRESLLDRGQKRAAYLELQRKSEKAHSAEERKCT